MMVHFVDVVLGVAGTSAAVYFATFYLEGRRVVRRIRKMPTTRAADVVAGPTELAGKLTVAGEPLASLAGVEVAAFRRGIVADYENDDSRGQTLEKVLTASVELEVEDESGSCILELDEMILLGPTTTHQLTPAVCEAEHPEIWAVVTSAVSKEAKVTSISVEETTLPSGVVGFVSGVASPSDRIDASAGGYRGGARRLRVTGTAEHPLLAAAWDEAKVLEFLEGPLRRTLAMALLSLIVAGIAIAVPLIIAGYARV